MAGHTRRLCPFIVSMWNSELQPIQSELAPNEELLWVGQPRQGLVFSAADVLMIPFSLLWGGVAIFRETTAILSGAPLFSCLWGIPFVLVGLYLIFGRFIFEAKQRTKTYYGNERVIIVSGIFNTKVTSLNFEILKQISIDQRSDGRGTITFDSPNSKPIWSRQVTWPGMNQPTTPSFDMIPEARKVYELVRNAQKQALKTVSR